jgi:hypothetical protein
MLPPSCHTFCPLSFLCWLYSNYYRKHKTDSGCICTRYVKNIFQKVKKIRKKISHVEGHALCKNVKFHIKSIIFMLCVKRQKRMFREIDYFSIKILSLLHGHKTCRFLLKRFCEHVTCQDMHDTFFLSIYLVIFLNMSSMYFK